MVDFEKKNVFYFAKVFYSYGRWRFIIFILSSFLTVVFETFGVALIVPILTFDPNEPANNEISKLVFEIFQFLGIAYRVETLLGFLVLTFSIKGLLFLAVHGLRQFLRFDLQRQLQLEFIQNYKELAYRRYVELKGGTVNNVVTTEINRAVNAFEKYSRVIVAACFLVVYVPAVFAVNWKASALVAIGGVILVPFFKKLSTRIKRGSMAITRINAETQNLFLQTIHYFKYLKATNSFDKLGSQLEKKVKSQSRINTRMGIQVSLPEVLGETFTVWLVAAILFYLVVIENQPLGNNLALLIFYQRTIRNLITLQSNINIFTSNIGSLADFERTNSDFVSHKERILSNKPVKFEKRIQFENISFSYGDEKILDQVNFELPKNSMVGIVGASGSGKTTLFDILVGLLKPSEGRMLIDDVDLNQADINDFRRAIGYVTQESVVFSDTVANNITFWQHSEPNDRALQDAFTAAGCDEFLPSLPNGMHTILGDRGVKLSGGQRQRISIAREIYKNPQIMIFDEATSALDSRAEQAVQAQIDSLKGQRTVLIIAHRLSTVRKCDRIYVLDHGRIAEEGDWESLTADKTSLFYEYCKMQHIVS